MFLEALAWAQFDVGDSEAAQRTLIAANNISADPNRSLRFAWRDFSLALAAKDREKANAIMNDTAKLPKSASLVASMSRLLNPPTPKPKPAAAP